MRADVADVRRRLAEERGACLRCEHERLRSAWPRAEADELVHLARTQRRG